jgi:predicted nucleic acid-binding protein
MISALDTSVLLDVFLPDPQFYAELASRFPVQSQMDRVLEQSQIVVEPISREAAFHAGRCFRAYRDQGGKRDRILADFLIGSHALKRASCLISRDRGFYGAYFTGLTLIDPARHS